MINNNYKYTSFYNKNTQGHIDQNNNLVESKYANTVKLTTENLEKIKERKVWFVCIRKSHDEIPRGDAAALCPYNFIIVANKDSVNIYYKTEDQNGGFSYVESVKDALMTNHLLSFCLFSEINSDSKLDDIMDKQNTINRYMKNKYNLAIFLNQGEELQIALSKLYWVSFDNIIQCYLEGTKNRQLSYEMWEFIINNVDTIESVIEGVIGEDNRFFKVNYHNTLSNAKNQIECEKKKLYKIKQNIIYYKKNIALKNVEDLKKLFDDKYFATLSKEAGSDEAAFKKYCKIEQPKAKKKLIKLEAELVDQYKKIDVLERDFLKEFGEDGELVCKDHIITRFEKLINLYLMSYDSKKEYHKIFMSDSLKKEYHIRYEQSINMSNSSKIIEINSEKQTKQVIPSLYNQPNLLTDSIELEKHDKDSNIRLFYGCLSEFEYEKLSAKLSTKNNKNLDLLWQELLTKVDPIYLRKFLNINTEWHGLFDESVLKNLIVFLGNKLYANLWCKLIESSILVNNNILLDKITNFNNFIYLINEHGYKSLYSELVHLQQLTNNEFVVFLHMLSKSKAKFVQIKFVLSTKNMTQGLKMLDAGYSFITDGIIKLIP